MGEEGNAPERASGERTEARLWVRLSLPFTWAITGKDPLAALEGALGVVQTGAHAVAWQEARLSPNEAEHLSPYARTLLGVTGIGANASRRSALLRRVLMLPGDRALAVLRAGERPYVYAMAKEPAVEVVFSRSGVGLASLRLGLFPGPGEGDEWSRFARALDTLRLVNPPGERRKVEGLGRWARAASGETERPLGWDPGLGGEGNGPLRLLPLIELALASLTGVKPVLSADAPPAGSTLALALLPLRQARLTVALGLTERPPATAAPAWSFAWYFARGYPLDGDHAPPPLPTQSPQPGDEQLLAGADQRWYFLGRYGLVTLLPPGADPRRFVVGVYGILREAAELERLGLDRLAERTAELVQRHAAVVANAHHAADLGPLRNARAELSQLALEATAFLTVASFDDLGGNADHTAVFSRQRAVLLADRHRSELQLEVGRLLDIVEVIGERVEEDARAAALQERKEGEKRANYLALAGAVALPLLMVSGVLGMNVLPVSGVTAKYFQPTEQVFWTAIGGALMASLGLLLWVWRGFHRSPRRTPLVDVNLP